MEPEKIVTTDCSPSQVLVDICFIQRDLFTPSYLSLGKNNLILWSSHWRFTENLETLYLNSSPVLNGTWRNTPYCRDI